MSANISPADLARDDLKHGRAPVPLRGKVPWDPAKGCGLADWQNLIVTEATIETLFGGPGITGCGVLNGPPSNDITDVDLDIPEAAAAAPVFLPKTTCVFGRPSAPRTHFVYTAPGAMTKKFIDVSANGKSGAMLVELRGEGSQSVWPGSLRLAETEGEQDEVVRFELGADGAPAPVAATELRQAVVSVAVCALLARHWPRGESYRHDLALAAAGFLLRRGVDQAMVETIIGTAARIAGDEEAPDRVKAVRTTAERLARDGKTTGAPTLAKLLGDAVIQRLEDWLGDGSVGSGGDSAASGERWGEPISLDVLAVKPFPTDALPEVVRNFVEDVARVTQVPVDLPGTCTRGAVAAAAARRAKVAIGGTHEEPLNLNVAAIAKSGERKGPAFRAALAPLYAEQEKLRAATARERAVAAETRKAAEKRIELLRAQSAKEADDGKRKELVDQIGVLAAALPPVPPKPTLVVSDRTPEKLALDLAEQDGAVLMASEEAETLFAIAGGRYAKDGGAQMDVYLKAYDGGDLDVGRISREDVACPAPALSVIITPQPIVLENLRDRPEFHHRGFLPRFLFSYPRSLVGGRAHDGAARPNPAARERYARCLERILALPRQLPEKLPTLRIEGDALAMWIDYHDRIEREIRDDGRLSVIAEWANKQPGRVARTAGGLHLVETVGRGLPLRDLISAATMRAAVALGEYDEDHALAAYDAMRADPRVDRARRILAWIRRKGLQKFTAREALHDLPRAPFPSMEELIPALTLLVGYEHLHRLPAPPPGSQGGRPPSPIYEVNPRILENRRQNRHNPEDPTNKRSFVGSVGENGAGDGLGPCRFCGEPAPSVDAVGFACPPGRGCAQDGDDETIERRERDA